MSENKQDEINHIDKADIDGQNDINQENKNIDTKIIDKENTEEEIIYQEDSDDWDNELIKPDDNFKQSFINTLMFLVLSTVMGIWIMQKSINAYYLQTYHQPSPLNLINHPLWQKGGNIGDGLYTLHDNIANNIDNMNKSMIDEFNDNYAYTPAYKAQMAEKARQEQLRQEQERQLKAQDLKENQAQNELEQSLTLNKSQKVFFAGDSMMQGIAPHMQKYLQGLGVDSINLSKQSTGLAYPKFFDWNSTIKNTLRSDSNIKVLIIMLGANDPWDIPDKQGKYLKFNSEEWIAEYQARMKDILDFAKERQVGVIWVTPPNMKKNKLNEKMVQLNDVMMNELARHNVKVIDARPIMGGCNNIYNDYLEKDGKNIKMRSTDGVHFSGDGQRILAKEVQSYLIIE
ncbi:Protein of uncharacterised function (DUF459) [Moraxella caprae]|uniref:Protein of uncharacterized function (DUF459) n=1 Tax=Moraxella caprae TaxID=90240 RepID=A0A378R1P9_9GAMM|nr:DUF459 domain-containing protein [Moraxella caprae]STZ09114.1 Protein of uncharacterised function (DUF459) [Moraxella caprae]